MSHADRARRAVADWILLVVSGLPEHVARDRFDETASDLWEHQHDAEEHGRSTVATAASIVLRAVRGVPADLMWRWSAARPTTRGAPTTTWAKSSEGTTMTKKQNPAAKPWVDLKGL